MKTTIKLFVSALVVVAFWQAASAQPTVTFQLVNNSLEIFFLKDFDINSPASGPPIFLLDVRNDGTLRDGILNSRVVLELSVSSRKFGQLSSGRTRPFTLLPNQSLRLNNNNLFSNNDSHRLFDYRVADDLVKKLLQDILATGKLPSDVYTFDVRISDETQPQQPFDSGFIEIRVSNPKKLDLIFPGSPVSGRSEDCPEIFTNLPQFRWESDMRRFQVIVAEARPGEDPESALNQDPRFVKNFAIGNIVEAGFDPLPSTSFQYPPTDTRLTLRPGVTYYWRVLGIVNTSGGDFQDQSEIYCFRLASLDDLAGRRQQLEFLLRNILGSDFDKIFGEGGELADYQPSRITVNGQAVTLADLIAQLKDISAAYKGYRIE